MSNKKEKQQFPLPESPLAAPLKDIDPTIMEIYKQRVKAWHEKYPLGEPYFKRSGPWRMFIEVEDIMVMYNKPLRWAQRLLANIRVVAGKSKNASISVKQFCELEELDEEHTREFLDELHKNDYEE
jgi:hypothetical protein